MSGGAVELAREALAQSNYWESDIVPVEGMPKTPLYDKTAANGAGVEPVLATALLALAEENGKLLSQLSYIRDTLDIAIGAHDPADPRHRGHGGQHTNGRCCAFGNLNPGAVGEMRRMVRDIDALALPAKERE